AEYRMGGNGLERLKEIAPSMPRVAVLRSPAVRSSASQFAAIQAVAPSLKMEINPLNMQDGGEIERAVTAFARSPNGGLIVTVGPPAILHRNLIVSLAARPKLTAVYYEPYLVAARSPASYRTEL